MAAQFYKINYKSDFVLTINSDAGWAVPFCIKFWTGMPSHGYFAGFDGENYVNCRVGETPTQLLVMFDDHHMPIGPLRMQIAYHTTIEEFPDRKFDEVTNPTNVTVDIDGTEYQVMLDFTGETGAEIDFSMPSSGVMSVNGKIGYVTLNAEDVGAQPTIEDLATIRSGAAAGATAVQPAEMTAALATKQDTINDLATIRSGAAAGATAVQPATLQEGLATKQDTISDLATIRSGATAGATAVQPAALQEGLATKQDVISDLSTIRSGAAAGATAVQPAALTPIESDIDAIEGKIPSAASTSNQLADKAFVNSALADKADTSDIPTALSQLSQDSTHRVVTDAEKSTWNGKQDTISDLATIRSGAAAGATAVQPAAMNTALAAKQDMLTFDNAPTANSDNPVKSSGIKIALDAKQSTISTVNVTVDNNTGTPSGSASVSGSTLSLSFQNLKGATGATGATGPRGERGLPGESGVTGDVSGFTVIQTIDPSATYGATDIAGAATVQATNQELTELEGELYGETADYYGYESGVYIRQTDGALLSDSAWCITGYIPCVSGDEVTVNFMTTGKNNYACCGAYDANKNFLAAWTSNGYTNSRSFTMTGDTAYIRCSLSLANVYSCSVIINGESMWNPVEKLTNGFVDIVSKGVLLEEQPTPEWFQGSLKNDNSYDITSKTAPKRIICTLASPYLLNVVVADGYWCSIHEYSALFNKPTEIIQGDSWIANTHGWFTGTQQITPVANSKTLVIILAKGDRTVTITPSEGSNIVMNETTYIKNNVNSNSNSITGINEELYGHANEIITETVLLEQGAMMSDGKKAPYTDTVNDKRIRTANFLYVYGDFTLTFTNNVQYNIFFYSDAQDSTYKTQLGIWESASTYTGNWYGYIRFGIKKANSTAITPTATNVNITYNAYKEGIVERVKQLEGADSNGYCYGTDMLMRKCKTTYLGTLTYLQAFCKYDGKYYSTNGSNIAEQDENFNVLRNVTCAIGHGNSLQLVGNGKAWASGWDDQKMYRVDLATLAVDQTITLPTTGYTTCAVDEDNGWMYIFQRQSNPSTEAQYNFIKYDYVNEQIINTRKIEVFAAMQAVDYFQGKILMLYGLGTTTAPSGMRIYNTNGDVLVSFDLEIFKSKEPEGIIFTRDKGELLVSDVDKKLYVVAG